MPCTLCSNIYSKQLTSGGFVEVTFDQGDELGVLVEASVVQRVLTQAVHGLHVAAALQQHLHGVLAAKLAAQDQRRPEGVNKRRP